MLKAATDQKEKKTPRVLEKSIPIRSKKRFSLETREKKIVEKRKLMAS